MNIGMARGDGGDEIWETQNWELQCLFLAFFATMGGRWDAFLEVGGLAALLL